MLEILIKKGLDPKNIFLLGKCYSTNKKVYQKLKKIKINVSENSFYYNSYLSYDEIFKKICRSFLFENQEKLNSCEKILVLDDGGELISNLKDFIFHDNIAAMEQTTSGIEKIKNKKFNFPIINIATSTIKKKCETPFLMQYILNTISNYANIYNAPKIKILISNI